jgi:hypothetical protein
VIDRACTSERKTCSKRSRAKIVSLVTASPLVTAAKSAATPRRRSAARLSTRAGPAGAYAGSETTIDPPASQADGVTNRDAKKPWDVTLLERSELTLFRVGSTKVVRRAGDAGYALP